MIPLRDMVPRRGNPFGAWMLIALNGFVFFFEVSLPGAALLRFIDLFGVIPARCFCWETILFSIKTL